MSDSLIDRCFSILEVLASEPAGLSITAVADRLAIPKSAAHRLLGRMIRLEYVRQEGDTARYLLTTKLLSLGFAHLNASGIIDVAQPVLDQLARDCGELARLAVVDGGSLTWVAKAQGARSGLRYDPDMGARVTLFCTATGHAWLAALDVETAMELAAKQGFGRLDEHGPNAPRTISAFLKRLRRGREQGYSYVVDSASVGTSALAAVIRHPTTPERVIGTVNITGPSARLTGQRLIELAPRVMAAARELSRLSPASEYFVLGGRIEPAIRRRAVR